MSSVKTNKYNNINGLGIFNLEEAIQNNISQPSVSRLLKEGELIKLDHGVYASKALNLDPDEMGFAAACKRFGPKAYISGLSALFYYVLTENVPQETWVFLPKETQAGRYSQYKVIRTSMPLSFGVLKRKYYRIASVERTIIDAFVYSNQIGLKTAIDGCRIAIRESKTNEQKILTLAKKLKKEKVIINHWEAITAI